MQVARDQFDVKRQFLANWSFAYLAIGLGVLKIVTRLAWEHTPNAIICVGAPTPTPSFPNSLYTPASVKVGME